MNGEAKMKELMPKSKDWFDKVPAHILERALKEKKKEASEKAK